MKSYIKYITIATLIIIGLIYRQKFIEAMGRIGLLDTQRKDELLQKDADNLKDKEKNLEEQLKNPIKPESIPQEQALEYWKNIIKGTN